MISKNTAMEIAYAYREVETAEKLLAEIVGPMAQRQSPDIRDVFGHRITGKTATSEAEIRAMAERAWLAERDIEGLVFRHPDGRMAKIKKRDLGLTRKPLQAGRT